MRGFSKVCKFTVYESYNNARKIADDIVISLMKNTSVKEDEYLPTYISTVKEHFSCIFIGVATDENTISYYVIEVYEVLGNEKSKLSISQNKYLRDVIFPR